MQLNTEKLLPLGSFRFQKMEVNPLVEAAWSEQAKHMRGAADAG